MLGTVTALGVVDPDISDVLIRADSGRTTLTIIGVAALLPAAGLTWILHSPTPAVPALISLIGLRLLVIDVVAFTVDSTGLLDRLLPKP